MRRINNWASFGGWQQRWQHESAVLGCAMEFAVYLPPQAAEQDCPVLWWLSGLTCSDRNFVEKAGAQRYAAEHGIIIIAPDTSPRGLNLPGEHDHWDFGSGAGFYVNASQAPWSDHYRMYDYVVAELPELITMQFPVDQQRQAISGHSMGGHGALICALKNPGRYRAVSAFAPIVAPSQCPWGDKAFRHYLGADEQAWRAWDATALVEDGAVLPPTRIEQGLADEFLDSQLRTHQLLQAAEQQSQPECEPVQYCPQNGYDHSYFFIASFMAEHMHWHAQYLRQD